MGHLEMIVNKESFRKLHLFQLHTYKKRLAQLVRASC